VSEAESLWRLRHNTGALACFAHQLRNCQFAIEAGDAVFAPRMKALLLRAVILARRRQTLAASTRHQYRSRLDRDLDAIMALSPTNRHGQRLRKRYGKVRNDLFTFLIHPDVPPDNNGSERELASLEPTSISGPYRRWRCAGSITRGSGSQETRLTAFPCGRSHATGSRSRLKKRLCRMT